MDAPILPSHARIPSLDRIVLDSGVGFIFGGVAGSAFHFLKGLRGSPRCHRLAGGARAARVNAPRVTSVWLTWGCACITVESAMFSARRRMDPWNNIVAFAGATGLVSARRGPRADGRNALAGAAVRAFLEFFDLDYFHADPHRNRSPPPVDGPVPASPLPLLAVTGIPPAPPDVAEEASLSGSGSSGWFGGLFSSST